VSTYLSPLVTMDATLHATRLAMDATLHATLVAALDSEQRLSHIS
jgi:hypothetical protein